MTKPISIFAMTLICLILGCSSETSTETTEKISCRDTSLEFVGLGFEIEAWDQMADSVAGDFKFSQMGSPPTPLFNAFGESGEKGVNVASNFFLKDDAEVNSPINGQVTKIEFQAEDSDYEIVIDVDGCQISYDHIRNVAVSEGDSIKVGDLIGTPGPWDPGAGIGIIEIQIQDPGNDNPEYYCPLFFMSDANRAATEADLSQLMSDIELLVSDDTTYDEDSMVYQGCVTTTEFE